MSQEAPPAAPEAPAPPSIPARALLPSVPTQDRPRGRRNRNQRSGYTDEVLAHLRSGQGVLLLGDAGVGKTHIANYAVRELVLLEGVRVVSVTGTAARRSLPLGAFEQMFAGPELLGGSAARVAEAILDAVGVARADLEQPDGGITLVVRVENAHLLDASSALVVDWLARHEPVVVLACARHSAASWSPWLELWKDGVLERVDVHPLTFDETRLVLEAELGGVVSADSVHAVWAQTRGNAFYLGELVRDSISSGRLSADEGVWSWAGGGGPSRRLIDIASHDIDAVSDDARALLEEVALLGPVPLDEVLDGHARTVLSELQLHGLVTTAAVEDPMSAEVSVAVAHPLYGEAVASLTSGQRRRDLLKVATLGHAPRSAAPEDLLRYVGRALESRVPVHIDLVREAFEAAMRLRAIPAAIALITSMLGTYEDLASAEVRLTRADLLLRRAEAWRCSGNAMLTLDDLREAREIVGEAPADERAPFVVRAALIEADTHHLGGDDVAAGLRVLDDALSWATGEQGPVARAATAALVRSRLAHLAWAGRFAESLEEMLRELADPSREADVLCLVAPAVAGLGNEGRFSEADALVARYLPVAAHAGVQYRWGSSEIMLAALALRVWAGDPLGKPFAVPATRDLRVVAAAPYAHDRMAVHLWKGLAAAASGAWSTARDELHVSNVRLRAFDMYGSGRFPLAVEALAAAAVRDTVGSRALMSAVRSMPHRTCGAIALQIDLILLDTTMWLRDPMVLSSALELASRARAGGQWRVELEALHRAVIADRTSRGSGRPAEHDAVLARVEALAQKVEGARAGHLRDHVRALVQQDGDLARIAERELNRFGLWLPPQAPVASLTAREQEIASLAAGGMTSRAIAVRLTLSVRTVDSHLARVFAKLGINSREQLGDLLR